MAENARDWTTQDEILDAGYFINMVDGTLRTKSQQAKFAAASAAAKKVRQGVTWNFTDGPEIFRITPGQPFTPSLTVSVGGYGFAHVPGYSTGEPGNYVRFGGQLRFTGPTITLEDPGTPFAGLTFPLTMTGEFYGYPHLSGPGTAPLFSFDFTGNATTWANFRRFDEFDPLQYINVQSSQGITFHAQEVPAPVPEPATLLLVTSGLAVACARVGRSRLKSSR